MRQLFWPEDATTRFGWIGYAAGVLAVVLVSVVIGVVLGRIAIANISMLYLIAIIATAIAFGRGPAVAASVAAFDFFFVEPVHTFTVADPEEWVALLLFLVTGVVTGGLAADQRRRAREAEERKREAEGLEREAVVLYDVVRLLGEPELGPALRAVAERPRPRRRTSWLAARRRPRPAGACPAAGAGSCRPGHRRGGRRPAADGSTSCRSRSGEHGSAPWPWCSGPTRRTAAASGPRAPCATAAAPPSTSPCPSPTSSPRRRSQSARSRVGLSAASIPGG